jgi:hypothetical protein
MSSLKETAAFAGGCWDARRSISRSLLGFEEDADDFPEVLLPGFLMDLSEGKDDDLDDEDEDDEVVVFDDFDVAASVIYRVSQC